MTFNLKEDRYNYEEEVKYDFEAYVEDQGISPYDYDFETLYDLALSASSITGNCDGSYTMNKERAEENLCGNWDLMVSALDALELDLGSAESADVAIRCYLLEDIVMDYVEC